jgi:cation transport ATPase
MHDIDQIFQTEESKSPEETTPGIRNRSLSSSSTSPQHQQQQDDENNNRRRKPQSFRKHTLIWGSWLSPHIGSSSMRAWLGVLSLVIFIIYTSFVMASIGTRKNNKGWTLHLTQVLGESDTGAAIAWASSVTYSIGILPTLKGETLNPKPC